MLGPEVCRIGQESIFGSFVHLSYLEHNSKEYIDSNVEEHVKSISAGDMVILEEEVKF